MRSLSAAFVATFLNTVGCQDSESSTPLCEPAEAKAGRVALENRAEAVVCAELCNASDVPSAVKAMRDAFPVIAQELWDRGSPIESAVRAIAVVDEFGEQFPYVDWPLSRPIADFVRIDDRIGFGQGTLEDNTASVQALMDLRASFLRGDHGVLFWNQLPVASNGSYYRLYLRDTLPFEDAQGLVPLTAYGVTSILGNDLARRDRM